MDDDQQFCLRWNNHQSTLISVFDTLLENETLVDCTLAAEGKFLKAHKVVLSACSPYFATLLQEQYDKHPIFILKDVKYQELRAMMDYMYRGEVNISQDQLAALLKAAESLQIKGLSDNRNTGGSSSNASSKLDTSHQQQPRSLNVPVGSKMAGGFTLEQTKRARLGTSSIVDTQELSASREGSASPSRRRRKVRRRSIENTISDLHADNSNTSQQLQSNAVGGGGAGSGLSAITAAASALAAAQLPASALVAAAAIAGAAGSSPGIVSAPGTAANAAVAAAAAAASIGSTSSSAAAHQLPTSSVTKKTENVKGTTTSGGGNGSSSNDALNTDNLTGSGPAVASNSADEQEQQNFKNEKLNQKSKAAAAAAAGASGKDATEMVLEPKSEYDDEGNDETVEDLTLDDEEMAIDDLAGPSQSGEGSSQGYVPWQHDRSQDELLLATQETQQRDPQAAASCPTSSSNNGSNTSPTPSSQSLVRDYWYELKFSDLFKFINPDGRYQCPRFNCLKSYKDASSLQRHIRYECGGQKKFRCLMCGKAFSQSSHLKRHLESGVCVKYYL